MARIFADRGLTRTPDANFYSFLMDCGCEIRIDELEAMRLDQRSVRNLMEQAMRTADAHKCEIVVIKASADYRRYMRDRQLMEAPRAMYMGIDLTRQMREFQTQILGTFIPPQQDIAAEVRRAANSPERSLVTANSGVKKEDAPRPDRFDLIEID